MKKNDQPHKDRGKDVRSLCTQMCQQLMDQGMIDSVLTVCVVGDKDYKPAAIFFDNLSPELRRDFADCIQLFLRRNGFLATDNHDKELS